MPLDPGAPNPAVILTEKVRAQADAQYGYRGLEVLAELVHLPECDRPMLPLPQ